MMVARRLLDGVDAGVLTMSPAVVGSMFTGSSVSQSRASASSSSHHLPSPFELLHKSVGIGVYEWILPPVRVVVDRG